MNGAQKATKLRKKANPPITKPTSQPKRRK
jgi:hypothetical protein